MDATSARARVRVRRVGLRDRLERGDLIELVGDATSDAVRGEHLSVSLRARVDELFVGRGRERDDASGFSRRFGGRLRSDDRLGGKPNDVRRDVHERDGRGEWPEACERVKPSDGETLQVNTSRRAAVEARPASWRAGAGAYAETSIVKPP